MDAEEDRAKRTVELLVKCLRGRMDDVAVDFDEDGVLGYMVTERPSWSGNVVVKPRGSSFYSWVSCPSCLVKKKTSWQETLSQLLGSTISLAGVDGDDVQIGELEIPATSEGLEITLDLLGEGEGEGEEEGERRKEKEKSCRE